MATSESESCCVEVEDNDSIECFQNYSASEVFIQGLAGLVDQQDVESMIRAQKQILQRFEKTNEMLSNCNTLSVTRLKVANQQFKNYKQLLVDMKKDLDYTFKKINLMKTKLRSQYPDSVVATASKAGELNQASADVAASSTSEMQEGNVARPLESCDLQQITIDDAAATTTTVPSHTQPEIEQTDKKTEISDGNSSESGEADSHVESISISTSDTA